MCLWLALVIATYELAFAYDKCLALEATFGRQEASQNVHALPKSLFMGSFRLTEETLLACV